jgi:uncharacterized membrane protein YebE (DUF533 family)
MDANKVLAQLLASGAASGFAGGLAGGLLASKSGRKLGKKALKLGGLAAVAGVAWTAWSRWQESQRAGAAGGGAAGGTQDPPPARFLPPGEAADELGLVLVRAMIAAAQADGRLDGAEREVIARRIAQLEISEADRAALRSELARPVAIDSLVAAAGTPERALEIYTASLLTIDPDTPAERAYLELLAARLGIAPELAAAVRAQLAGETAVWPSPAGVAPPP